MECLNNLINHPISIHAPREGCDRKAFKSISKAKHFNPRTPRGVRHCGRALHPGRPAISIHAPREGCDGRAGAPAKTEGGNFNPRTPRGVRLVDNLMTARFRGFQSTHPARGATYTFVPAAFGAEIFQSTHPARGATMAARLTDRQKNFQSTHPARGATLHCGFRTG